jgi:hypothetical protein
MKEETNIRPKHLVHGMPEKEMSLIATGRVPMMKNSQRGQIVACG